MAHKTNHSFAPNSEFVEFRHPKYGVIPCIITTKDIRQNQEVTTITTVLNEHHKHLQIFVSYGYDVSESPQWFQDQWETFQGKGEECEEEQEPGGQVSS